MVGMWVMCLKAGKRRAEKDGVKCGVSGAGLGFVQVVRDGGCDEAVIIMLWNGCIYTMN